MNYLRNILAVITIAAIAMVGNAFGTVGTDVNADITGPTTWTKANSPYRLKTQIYVKPGGTLTMEAGTVVATLVADQGSLAVCRGGIIRVMGTQYEPVIMTSAQDLKEWAGSVCVTDPCGLVTDVNTMGDPKTGKWLERCNDWGSLAIMGNGLISASKACNGGNPATPTGTAVLGMEGLVAQFPGDPNVLYGGANDNDDSGEIHYLSIRYGGKVVGQNNELNGLSLGGIGRATDIDHVEIMNNVDDGIEIWGGTVNLKYVSIWNIGDDSLDCDQGWRGKAQFGLIVQGYSINAGQGSGVGDNLFEMDGAEDSDAQPITTATIYNFTAIGQPVSGDHGTAWRDNAHIQYRNCIFMDLGEDLVKNDNKDNDPGCSSSGYGFNGTLSFVNSWTTPYTYRSPVNAGTWTAGAFNDPNVLYTVQTSGNLCEITDSVFYNNLKSSAYTEADARGVRAPGNNNVTAAAGVSPIQRIVRGPAVSKGGFTMLPVIRINPCAANDAVTSVAAAPSDDGFFKPAQYRGGFSADNNWLEYWTATYAYGMTDTANNIGKSDLDNDGETDFADFSIFSDGWLQVN